MVLLKSKMVELGSSAIDFNLKGTDEKSYTLKSFESKDILVVIFMCNHCPYVKATIDRFVALQNKHKENSVQFVGINSNDSVNYPEDSFKNMKKWASEKKISFPYVIDETQEVAKVYQAVCTPDIFVYDQSRSLAYRGRLDDNWQEPTKVTENSLDVALQDILKKQKVSIQQIPAIGCSIKWKE
jgi:peroxiredoxin